LQKTDLDLNAEQIIWSTCRAATAESPVAILSCLVLQAGSRYTYQQVILQDARGKETIFILGIDHHQDD
jgi:hypothetical protein